jgi:hypothetical protein
MESGLTAPKKESSQVNMSVSFSFVRFGSVERKETYTLAIDDESHRAVETDLMTYSLPFDTPVNRVVTAPSLFIVVD